MGLLGESIKVADHAMKYVMESRNPAMMYAFNTALAEIKFAVNDFKGALKIINQLEKDDIRNSVLYASGHAHYLVSMVSFELGDFDSALKHIAIISHLQTRDAPFYESELAVALKARVLFERGLFKKSINQLHSLDRQVTEKHWPYQMCIIKLHLAEVLIRRGMLEPPKDLPKIPLDWQEECSPQFLSARAILFWAWFIQPIIQPQGGNRNWTEPQGSCSPHAGSLILPFPTIRSGGRMRNCAFY